MAAFHYLFILILSLVATVVPNKRHNYSLERDELLDDEINSEHELQYQLEEIYINHRGWTDWSEWSVCTRSCDGGISRQLRMCTITECFGENVRYKICNMQPCSGPTEYRADQCSAFDNTLYEGQFYNWFPHHDEDAPCSLICAGKLKDMEKQGNRRNTYITVRLADKVLDGTRCRRGSLDMCIDGKCQAVGCDLQIGSNLQTDSCGTCGGDGNCTRPLYSWLLEPTSLCSVTCGGGYQMVQSVCQNRANGLPVEEQLCDPSEKPHLGVIACNTHFCRARWSVGEWSNCSASCGEGIRMREVKCLMEINNTNTLVNESNCSSNKPNVEKACIERECSEWKASFWSGCSVSCGEGVQMRIVECKDIDNHSSKLCSMLNRPSDKRACSTGIQCPRHTDKEQLMLAQMNDMQEINQQHILEMPVRAEKLVEERVVPSESTFFADEFGTCSTTCGNGIRRREVYCKIFLEISQTFVKLSDEKCSGQKPSETEPCFIQPCMQEKIDIKDDPFRADATIRVGSEFRSTTYSWKKQGYTHCSATCLGGVQELIVHCVRDDTQKVISPYLCPKELKPEILIRTCNDHPCPPRWNYTEFSPCSQTCGIGIQTRDVNCIHEVTQSSNIAIIPNNRCPQPPPPDRQYCNVLDCPIRWKVSEWSRCSKSCGGGEKIRKIECKQVMAQNHTVDRLQHQCPSPKPPDTKPCNTKSCVLESDKPQIDTSNSTFIQHDSKKKKISLKIGGAATVFEGTVVKIKCPVKRFNRTKIQWMRDRRTLSKSKKYKMSKKGALRIQNLLMRDSGVYTCIAGKSTASLLLTVKHVPGRFPNSEEIQRHMYKNNPREFGDYEGNRREHDLTPKFISDDHSHEQRPYSYKQKSVAKSKLTTSTLPSQIKFNKYSALPSQFEVVNNQNQSLARTPRMATFLEKKSEQRSLQKAVVRRENMESLKYEWVYTDWSACSQTCGGSGSQMRSIKCIVKFNNSTQNVENNLCQKAGLTWPSTIRKCGFIECPNWYLSRWIPCNNVNCIYWNVGKSQEIIIRGYYLVVSI